MESKQPDALSIAESEFEAEVLRHLQEEGYDCDAQVKEGAYSIDIAVRNPRNTSVYLLGIECDGASFHSSETKRSADRARQEVLEQSGWTIHRIWSTDWFRNPEAEIEKIVNVLVLEEML